MRPPDLPGGNRRTVGQPDPGDEIASMRPPDLPGGNLRRWTASNSRSRRASMRPPDLPGGNRRTVGQPDPGDEIASMRPPDLPGGNYLDDAKAGDFFMKRFNEAAGFTRRKQRRAARRAAGMCALQ